MTDEAAEVLTPWQLQQRHFDSLWGFWRDKLEATDELQRFLSGDRYVDDNGAFNRDRRGVQIHGQEIADTIRHVVAKATERPRSVEARPKDHDGDPETAEAMVALIADELTNPYKGFERERYAAIQACREGRRGVVWMDWVPDHGAYGELFWSFQPNGSVIWDAAYHPHHPLCQVAIRHKRIPFEQANRDYGVTWLRPDNESLSPHSSNWKAGVPLAAGFTDRIASQAVNDRRVTIREVWIKNDPTETPDRKIKSTQKLVPADRYMSCKLNCGGRSATQGTLKAQGLIRKALPEEIPGATHEDDPSGCPRCGGPMTRIDAIDRTQAQLMYAKGRRMIVVAPFCPGPEGNAHLYDGSWPISTLRSFPALFQFASVKPGDNSGGPCDVDMMWDQQVASDNLMTCAVQRVFEHRDYWKMPSIGINNAAGERFEFRDDDDNVMFEDMTKRRNGPLDVQHIAGSGLDQSWPQVYGTIQTALLQFRPTGDIGLQPNDSKDIAVGTVEQIERQGEVPTEDFIRRCNQELSMWYGVVEDGIRATYTPERLARLNIDGADHLLEVWGESLPNFDYVVTETPDFTGIDDQKAKAWDAAMQTAMTLGPEALDAWGQFHSVPKSVIKSIQKLFAEKAAADAAQMASGGQGVPAAAGMSPAGGSPEANPQAGPTPDAGMSAPVAA